MSGVPSCRHLRHGRHPLGHLLAPLHRPRHLLDARPHRDPHVRRPGRHLLRLPDPLHHLRASAPLSAASVKIWGFRRPWAPLSPPGAASPCSPRRRSTTGGTTPTAWTSRSSARRTCVLAAGIVAMHLGALILILGCMNRAPGADGGPLGAALPLRRRHAAGLPADADHGDTRCRSHHARRVRSIAWSRWWSRWCSPASRALADGAGRPPPCAGSTSSSCCCCVWILPLFPAHAEARARSTLQVTHFVPPEFPLLLIAPALALDLLWSQHARIGTSGCSAVVPASFSWPC